MAFQGSLAELHLPDIIQLISVSGKTGVFHLKDGALHGEIFLNEGKIVHAQLDEVGGEEAVYALADRTLDVRISHLRRKLGDTGDPEKIRTVWGHGYVFVPEAW